MSSQPGHTAVCTRQHREVFLAAFFSARLPTTRADFLSQVTPPVQVPPYHLHSILRVASEEGDARQVHLRLQLQGPNPQLQGLGERQAQPVVCIYKRFPARFRCAFPFSSSHTNSSLVVLGARFHPERRAQGQRDKRLLLRFLQFVHDEPCQLQTTDGPLMPSTLRLAAPKVTAQHPHLQQVVILPVNLQAKLEELGGLLVLLHRLVAQSPPSTHPVSGDRPRG